MRRGQLPMFLERQSYRRRRLIDAARAIPVFGVFLFLMPLVWPEVPGDGVSLAMRGIYVFGVWGALVLATLVISSRLQSRLDASGGDASEATDPDGAG